MKIVLDLDIRMHDRHYMAVDMANLAHQYDVHKAMWIQDHGEDELSEQFDHMRKLCLSIAKQFNKSTKEFPVDRQK